MKELFLCEVDATYLKYLHKLDSRVSVKFNNRPYVGVIVMVNGIEYVLPLTSKTTDQRKKDGRKKRSAKTTTYVRDVKGEEIANILHNNMIPVFEGVYTALDIDVEIDTYESNEIRFIRKNRDKIIAKSKMVHDRYVDGKDLFLKNVCCDFVLLEEKYKNYTQSQDTTQK